MSLPDAVDHLEFSRNLKEIFILSQNMPSMFCFIYKYIYLFQYGEDSLRNSPRPERLSSAELEGSSQRSSYSEYSNATENPAQTVSVYFQLPSVF